MHESDGRLPDLAGSCWSSWNGGRVSRPIEDEWLEGWDPTPGIVSVWAEGDGLVHVWRRVDGALVHETARFRPWMLVDSVDPLPQGLTHRELSGPGELRYLVRGDDMQALARLRGRTRHELVLAPEEQYLAASGRTYFKDLAFDQLRRMQIDLETTGLDPQRDRIFLIAIRDPDGQIELIEGDDEASLIHRLVALVRAADPDVIENHNLHGFDLPF